MRRYTNDNFFDSPICMGGDDEETSCTMSTELPFFQRGCRFSETAWLADLGEHNITPPRRRPTAGASRAPKTRSSASAPRSSGRGMRMLDKLSVAERALLRAHATAVRNGASTDDLELHAELVRAESTLRNLLATGGSLTPLTAASVPKAAEAPSPDRQSSAGGGWSMAGSVAGSAAPSECGEWEQVDAVENWLLVSDVASPGPTSSLDKRADKFSADKAGWLEADAGKASRSTQPRRRRCQRQQRQRAAGSVPQLPHAPSCLLGVSSNAHARAMLKLVGRFYQAHVLVSGQHASAAATAEARAVIAALPTGLPSDELAAASTVSLMSILGLDGPAASPASPVQPSTPTAAASASSAAASSTSRRRLQMVEVQ